MNFDEIRKVDAEIAGAIEQEIKRQREKIELIASENFVSEAVMQAMGTALTNKYAEGYPGKRYYGGCEYVDVVEDLARSRVKQIFGAQHANVQPHSGAQANMAVFFSILEPGDTILGMDLSHGGHLSHGMAKNFSGRYFNVVSYGVKKDNQFIDYDQVLEKAMKHRPKIIIAGASAYPRFIDFKKFREIADEAGAYLLEIESKSGQPVGAVVRPADHFSRSQEQHDPPTVIGARTDITDTSRLRLRLKTLRRSFDERLQPLGELYSSGPIRAFGFKLLQKVTNGQVRMTHGVFLKLA